MFDLNFPQIPRFGTRRRLGSEGFTLLELIVVVTMIGILAAIALPNLISMPRRADEAVLRTNLRTIRSVLDQHNGDKGFYPPSLEALVEEGYLRDVPYDPIYNASEWALVFEEETLEEEFIDFEGDATESVPGIIDVHSLSDEESLDNQGLYSEW